MAQMYNSKYSSIISLDQKQCIWGNHHTMVWNETNFYYFSRLLTGNKCIFLDIGIIRTKEVALKSCWLSFGQDINFSLIQDVRLVKCTSQIFMFHSILVVCAIIRPRKLLNQTSRQQMLSFNESLETNIFETQQGTHAHTNKNSIATPTQKHTRISTFNFTF